MAKILKWGNGKGVLLPKYVTTALGLKVNDAVIVSLDTESQQIVIAPKNQDGIQVQYFAKASVVANAAKAEERW
jgi:antitoxin component of MazEF toxin-antitoxin module